MQHITSILSDLISIQIPALVLYYFEAGVSHFGDVTLWRCPKKSTGVQFKKVVFETFYGWIYNPYTYHR